MAAKPPATPRWANVGGLIVEPSAGKKNVGWLDDEEPPAEYFNWFQNLTWQWTQYLSDGAILGPISITDDTIQLPEATDVGDLAMSGNLTTYGEAEVRQELRALRTGRFGSAGGDAAAFDAVIATGRMSASGRVLHGPETYFIPACAGQATERTPGVFGWHLFRNTVGGLSTAVWECGAEAAVGDYIEFPIITPRGMRISQWFAYVRDTAGGGTISARLQRLSVSGAGRTVAQIGATQTSSGTGTEGQVLQQSGLAEEDLLGGRFYHIHVIANNGTNGNHAIYGAGYQLATNTLV